jgi:hypothetical protein
MHLGWEVVDIRGRFDSTFLEREARLCAEGVVHKEKILNKRMEGFKATIKNFNSCTKDKLIFGINIKSGEGGKSCWGGRMVMWGPRSLRYFCIPT